MEEPSLQTVDYIAFVSMLVVSLAIGVYFSVRGNKTTEDFLMGSRKFSSLPVAMSLLTSYMSAIGILGLSGEAYAYGCHVMLCQVGTLIGITGIVFFIVPVLFPLRLTSINEYIELRFNSPALAKTVSLIAVLQGIFYMGNCLFAPTIALATVTNISSLTYIYILGIVVTVYSSIGGMKAVVWTDVFQLCVVLLGLLAVVVVGLLEVGSFSKVWTTALEGGRLSIFNTNPSLYQLYNVYNTVAFGFFYTSAFFCITQTNFQRLCSVRSMSEAKKVLWLNALGLTVIYVLILGGGTIAYAAYAGCDPWLLQIIDRKEEILPHFVLDRLSFAGGLPGLFVATLMGGALSSISSVINSLVALIWQDYCLKISFFADMKPGSATIINKVLSFLIGGVAIIGAVVASKAHNLIQFSMSVMGASGGGVTGTFLLGFFAPKTNLKGVWTGLFISIILMCWTSIGAFLYGKPAKYLPFSTDNCTSVDFNMTQLQSNTSIYLTEKGQLTKRVLIEENFSQDDFPLMWLYGISFTLTVVIGTCLCVLIAIAVSCITGNQDVKNVSPQYVSPVVRRFYWAEETKL